ncbi:hypothetical protein O181_054971 [Austropuccinia psidii MF-1]|uniref:Uncharacterized protein n=1 Tax=Austropuccinia psidii MF-1 TaxID=1389203 RepID=A0A9Q3EAF1_9BASI|nr:hypothetical protein [Austropuccinia psidii MF-1]
MRPKGAKGRSTPVPKARWVPNHKWAHLSPILAPISAIQKWPKGPQDPNWPRTTSEPPSTNGLWQLKEATSSGPARLPLKSGEDLSINVPCTKGSRHGAYMV